jgi:hypothetical protein
MSIHRITIDAMQDAAMIKAILPPCNLGLLFSLFAILICLRAMSIYNNDIPNGMISTNKLKPK